MPHILRPKPTLRGLSGWDKKARTRREACFSIEALEDRSCPSVTFGAVGDSASDEWSVIGVAGYYTWIEFLDLTDRAYFGEIKSFSSGDPRGISGGIGFEYNFAAYGATTENYLGNNRTFFNPLRVVQNYHSQVGSPSHPADWGGIRKLGLDGAIEYMAFFIGQSDLLNRLGPGGLADGPRPDIVDAVIGRITQGLDIATANGTSPVKVLLLQLHDLAQLPAWDPFGFTPQQEANIAANVVDFNNKLANLADSRGYGLVSLADLWNQAISPEGLWVHGWRIDPYDTDPPGSTFEGENNFFIIDGFHPTPIVHALWANLVLAEIIDHFGETDVELFTEKELVHFSGLDPQDAPTAIASGPYVVIQGDSLTLDASASYDPDLGDVLSYSWDINGDGVFGDALGVQPTLTWAELAALGVQPGETYHVRVQVDDGFFFDNLDVSDPVTLTVLAGPPVANAGGVYSAYDGEAVLLSADASTGASDYAWDLDNDGEYDDAFGPHAVFFVNAGGPTQVGLFVIGPGGWDTDTATIEVLDAAPFAGIIGTQETLRGQTAVFVVAAYDPSPTQMSAGFTYEFDWDGDGNVDETVHEASLAVFLHTFDSVGEFAVAVRAVDSGGKASPWAVNPVSVIDAPPIAFIQNLTPALLGQPVVFIIGAYDPSPLDMAAGFTYQIDWDGNGSVDQTTQGEYLAIVLHTFSTAGEFQVAIRAIDEGGTASDWSILPVSVMTSGAMLLSEQTNDNALSSDLRSARSLVTNNLLPVIVDPSAQHDPSKADEPTAASNRQRGATSKVDTPVSDNGRDERPRAAMVDDVLQGPLPGSVGRDTDLNPLPIKEESWITDLAVALVLG